jgi:hypothetical protein
MKFKVHILGPMCVPCIIEFVATFASAILRSFKNFDHSDVNSKLL